jgi:hypothetical protein
LKPIYVPTIGCGDNRSGYGSNGVLLSGGGKVVGIDLYQHNVLLKPLYHPGLSEHLLLHPLAGRTPVGIKVQKYGAVMLGGDLPGGVQGGLPGPGSLGSLAESQLGLQHRKKHQDGEIACFAHF